MQTLQFLVDELSRGRNFHISIFDLSGILDTPTTKMKFKNIVHLKSFCNIAKSTTRGYRLCQHCKLLANDKATREKAPFGGYCFQGLYEVAHPVIIGDGVAAIVYVGNAVIDEEKPVSIIENTCARTGVNSKSLCDELKKCEHLDSPKELFKIAELIADYLLLLHEKAPKEKEPKKLNWLVYLMKRHADELYQTNMALSEFAESYQKNAKYLGRLFKKEMGMSYAEYNRQQKLFHAREMIAKGDKKIIDIALECGFDNISYFNRSFRTKYGVSPGNYRKTKNKKSPE